MYSSVQCSVVQYIEVQCGAVQWITVWCSTLQCSAVHHSTVQHNTVQYSAVQHSTVKYSAVQHSTVKYNTIQYSQSCPAPSGLLQPDSVSAELLRLEVGQLRGPIYCSCCEYRPRSMPFFGLFCNQKMHFLNVASLFVWGKCNCKTSQTDLFLNVTHITNSINVKISGLV